MENEELSYSTKRYIERIKASPFIEPNKQLLIKYIEQKAKEAGGYFNRMTLLIGTIREFNDINLSNLTNKQVRETLEKLNNLRWAYSYTTFIAVRQVWVNFLEFIKKECNLDINPKAEAKAFNSEQKRRFMTMTKFIRE